MLRWREYPSSLNAAKAFLRIGRSLVVAWGGALVLQASAQVVRVEPANGDLLESGVPPFAIFGVEALGLSSPPTDLHLMPDGRLLLFAARQIALGDGVRWDAFRQAPEGKNLSTIRVAVDHAGEIYMGVPGGFSRVVFGEDGLWRLVSAAPWPAAESPSRPVTRNVIEAGNEWFWHSGSGSVISWHPGQAARIAGQANLVTHIFGFQGQIYLSDQTKGDLHRLKDGSTEPSEINATSIDSTVTCSQPYDADSVLLGTFGHGLQVFNGRTMRSLLPSDSLAATLRIDDMCETEGHLYAAAVENYGIIFFNHEGRILQVLDRSRDSRLSRVKKLLPAPGGVIWALLEDGVLRVEFPARLSNFEPLIGTGVTTGNTHRLDGKLWVVVNGKASQGVYDAKGRLSELAPDTPAGRFVSSFSTATGLAIAGTDKGAYFRDASGWVLFAPESENLRVLDRDPLSGRWLYSAKNSIGWLVLKKSGIVNDSIPVPGLNNVYSNITDSGGNIWLELGNSRLGRIRFEQGRPIPELYDERDGVPEGWAQVFTIEGTIGFNIADQIMRFDESTRRFLPDLGFSAKYAGLSEVFGRPGVDSLGRLWITANGAVQVLEKRAGVWRNLQERMPAGLRPFYFTFENNGVVWLHADRHLVRYDPSLPQVRSVPLRAIITHVNLVTSNRTLFALSHELPPLDYSDNSLNAHFMAPGNPFIDPVTFEVMLEGAGNEWVSTGGSGSAVFNRLKEGHYTLHVRPRSGDNIGGEATLSFFIRPPWYRSPLAYVLYSVAVLGLGLLAFWLVTFLHRRENTRLERLVARRTGELKESNLRLASQVEEIRMLSQAIGQSPVGVYITRPDGTIVFANPRASELSGYFVAELTGRNTSLLRSDLVTGELLAEISATVQRGESWSGQLANCRKDGATLHVRTTISPIRSPDGVIRHHLIFEEDISEWLADQERRQRLEAQLFQSQKLESLGTLAGGIAHDFNNILTGILGYCELARFNAGEGTELMSQLREIRTAGLRAKDLVTQILTFSRRGVAELVPLDLAGPVAEALRLIRASTPAIIAISSRLQSGTVRADATQIQQVVLNLCTNAVHAIGDKPGRVDVTLQRVEVDGSLAAEMPSLPRGSCIRLTVTDTGQGMTPATLARIFDPFFTTKQQGEGTGLGLSIVQGIIAGHHGALRVHSVPGNGATFDLYFPLCHETAPPAPAAASPAPRGEMQEILVVDDEPSVATFVTARLQQLGFRVASFRDPREALSAYRADPLRFEALVTDLTMPHMTGLELIQKMRTGGPGLPAVIITGYGRDAGGTKLAALPNCQVLYKPFSGEDLARLLNLVISDGLPSGPTGVSAKS